jgi:hypothetical protein
MAPAQFVRRKAAGAYLKEKYGFGSEKTLAKLACLGGGPAFRKAGPAVIYEPKHLDEWALAQIGELQRSTSDTEAAWSDAERPLSGAKTSALDEINEAQSPPPFHPSERRRGRHVRDVTEHLAKRGNAAA